MMNKIVLELVAEPPKTDGWYIRQLTDSIDLPRLEHWSCAEIDKVADWVPAYWYGPIKFKTPAPPMPAPAPLEPAKLLDSMIRNCLTTIALAEGIGPVADVRAIDEATDELQTLQKVRMALFGSPLEIPKTEPVS